MKRADILDAIETHGPMTHGELNCAQYQLDRLVVDGVLHRRDDKRYAYVDVRTAIRAVAAERRPVPGADALSALEAVRTVQPIRGRR